MPETPESGFEIKLWHKVIAIVVLVLLCGLGAYVVNQAGLGSVTYSKQLVEEVITEATETGSAMKDMIEPTWPAKLDTAAYDQKLLKLANYSAPKPVTTTSTRPDGTVATSTQIVSDLVYASTTNVTVTGKHWPPEAVYPNGDAILPFKRILAYYGNFYSVHMGILGELPKEQVIAKLMETKAAWEAADPDTPVLPAIEYIAMVAQADAGADGMYRAMMPAAEIEKAYEMAKEIDGIVIYDLQVGKSPIEKELPKFRTYLERPEVHLALDPEFAMKRGNAPGTVIGTFDATEINYVIDYLSEIVREKQLPPKVLLVHRFTQDMVTNATAITPTPEVQVVMVMDGWGSKELKRGTYSHVIIPEPVQFAGIKMFYKNDLKPPSTGLLTPQEVLNLNPKPIFIQYQ